MTCSYNSFAERERVIVCVRSDNHQRLNSVDAAELLSEYGCQCVRCDGCTQRVSTFFWTPLYIRATCVTGTAANGLLRNFHVCLNVLIYTC
jgi:hypothetical protein